MIKSIATGMIAFIYSGQIKAQFLKKLLNDVQQTAQNLQGYLCIHSRLTTTTGSGLFKPASTIGLWTSTGIPGYDFYKKLTSVQGSQIPMLQAMEQAGCGGYIVKWQISGKDYSAISLLIKTEEKSFPDFFFKIRAAGIDCTEKQP